MKILSFITTGIVLLMSLFLLIQYKEIKKIQGSVAKYNTESIQELKYDIKSLKDKITSSADSAYVLRNDIMLIHKDLTGSYETNLINTNSSLNIEFKSIGDITTRMKDPECTNPAGYAKALAEIDEWNFNIEEQKSATELIKSLTDKLREMIVQEIVSGIEKAINSPSGNEALEQINKVKGVYLIYPKLNDDTEQKQLSEKITSALMRIDELRRLRYNAWVADKVQQAVDGYYGNKKLLHNNDDDLQLIKIFKEDLGSVDTTYLDPAVMDIYQHVLTLFSEGLKEPNRVKLAKELNSIELHRKTPIDF